MDQLKAIVSSFIATQLPQKEINNLGQLFSQIDVNSDGYLTIDEMSKIIERQHENTTYAELISIMGQIDTDRNGKISYNEFIACCLEASYLQNQQYLEYIFKSFDHDKSGKIGKLELNGILSTIGMELNGMSVEEMVESCDMNGDGEIDYC